jgi:Putative transposase
MSETLASAAALHSSLPAKEDVALVGSASAQFQVLGTVGVIAMLHTWDQTLKDHFHLHALIPAGALSFDHSHWLSACKNFLFPVTSLSRVFRGKFLDLLKQNIDRGKRS